MSIYTVNGSPLKYDNKWLATNGGTPSSELPSYDSSDAGKSLVVNSEGDGVEWQTVGSSGTVDQHYDSTSENPQSGTAVAEALQTVPDELPSITGNANKVLKVNADATGVEWASGGGSTVKKPVFLKSDWITTVDTSTNFMIWQLTAAQKAKLEGFTHPLFTVEVVMGWPDNPATTYYNIATFIRQVGNSGWPTMLPSTSTVAGTTIQSGAAGGFLVASGQYDYSLDIVGVLVTPGSGNHPQANTRCMFILKVEEVDV